MQPKEHSWLILKIWQLKTYLALHPYSFKKRFEQAFQLENVFMFYMYETQSFHLLLCILQMSSRISYMYLHTVMSN